MSSNTNVHEGPGHGNEILSLATANPDGSRTHQSWTVCECTANALRARLGPPQQESFATEDAVRATAQAVLNQPGTVDLSGGRP